MSPVRIEVTPGKYWTDAYHVYIDGEEIRNVTYIGKYDGDFEESELRADGMITYICEFEAEVEVTERKEIFFKRYENEREDRESEKDIEISGRDVQNLLWGEVDPDIFRREGQ